MAGAAEPEETETGASPDHGPDVSNGIGNKSKLEADPFS
jgi:hypothetical protein